MVPEVILPILSDRATKARSSVRITSKRLIHFSGDAVPIHFKLVFVLADFPMVEPVGPKFQFFHGRLNVYGTLLLKGDRRCF